MVTCALGNEELVAANEMRNLEGFPGGADGDVLGMAVAGLPRDGLE
jgi:hypothetical protein